MSIFCTIFPFLAYCEISNNFILVFQKLLLLWYLVGMLGYFISLKMSKITSRATWTRINIRAWSTTSHFCYMMKQIDISNNSNNDFLFLDFILRNIWWENWNYYKSAWTKNNHFLFTKITFYFGHFYFSILRNGWKIISIVLVCG